MILNDGNWRAVTVPCLSTFGININWRTKAAFTGSGALVACGTVPRVAPLGAARRAQPRGAPRCARSFPLSVDSLRATARRKLRTRSLNPWCGYMLLYNRSNLNGFSRPVCAILRELANLAVLRSNVKPKCNFSTNSINNLDLAC